MSADMMDRFTEVNVEALRSENARLLERWQAEKERGDQASQDLGRARHQYSLLEQRFHTSEENRRDLERHISEARELAIRQEKTVESEQTQSREMKSSMEQYKGTAEKQAAELRQARQNNVMLKDDLNKLEANYLKLEQQTLIDGDVFRQGQREVRMLLRQNALAKEKMDGMSREIEAKTKESRSLADRLTVIRTESNRKEQKLNTLTKDQEMFQKARNELKTLVSQNEELRTLVVAEQTSRLKLVEENTTLQGHLAMARQDLSKVSKEHHELVTKSSILTEQNEQYQGEWKKMKDRNEQLEEDHGRSNSVYENLRSELRMLFDENEQLRAERDGVHRRAKELEMKYNKILPQVQESRKASRNSREELEDLREKVVKEKEFRDKCQREITMCKDKIRTLVKQKQDLTTRCKELEEKALRAGTVSRRNVTESIIAAAGTHSQKLKKAGFKADAVHSEASKQAAATGSRTSPRGRFDFNRKSTKGVSSTKTVQSMFDLDFAKHISTEESRDSPDISKEVTPQESAASHLEFLAGFVEREEQKLLETQTGSFNLGPSPSPSSEEASASSYIKASEGADSLALLAMLSKASVPRDVVPQPISPPHNLAAGANDLIQADKTKDS